MPASVFIIYEKSALIRLGLISLLRTIEDASFAFDFRNVDNFRKNIMDNKPDFIIISKKYIEEIGVNSLKKLSDEFGFKIIALLKEHFPEENKQWAEEIYIDEEKVIISDKIEHLINQNQKNKKHDKGNNEISKRERAVLAMVAQGLTNKEIAEKLFISTHTVITHRKNIVKKLGIKTVSGLTVYAILNNIIVMEDLK
ncbi:MAG: LuxR C-terminal-related transcriptional regulator [Candidatus Hydrothermae bacterium]|nr:LuxR C-terminal-related transcriptional regulator [Candidatus Hydrothermae bacterium]